MNAKIVFSMILLFIFSSMLVFGIGLWETVRNDYMFPIGDSLVNANDTPNATYQAYLETRNNGLFTNEPYVDFVNFAIAICLFMLIYGSWREGYNAPRMSLREILISYNTFWIMLFYIAIIIFNFFKDKFFTDILLVLFEEIVLDMYMYYIFANYFPFFILLVMLLFAFANQLKQLLSIEQ